MNSEEARMRIPTKNLKPGTVMMTGEVVLKTEKCSKSYMRGGVKMDAVLENPTTKKRRLVSYAYCGTLSVKYIPE